jgi:hypothetical protein
MNEPAARSGGGLPVAKTSTPLPRGRTGFSTSVIGVSEGWRAPAERVLTRRIDLYQPAGSAPTDHATQQRLGWALTALSADSVTRAQFVRSLDLD